jgi:hypothetical protein
MTTYALIKTSTNEVLRYQDFSQAPEQPNPAKDMHWEERSPPVVPPAPRRIIRDWEFRNRFTNEQLNGIMRGAMAGDDAANLVWLRLSTASDGVNLDDPDNIAGVGYVAAAYPALNIVPAVILA